MQKYRILIVDDASTIRRLLADEIARDPGLEVVGTAANGKIALARMTQVNPDLVILDIEMPELDGLATLKELRRSYPRLPVIMFSALTERGAEATLDALALGASDYFTKPANVGSLDAALAVVRAQLVPAIKALCEAEAARPAPRQGEKALPKQGELEPCRQGRPGGAAVSWASEQAIEVVAIGASTGGPNALAEVFTCLPADFPVPLVIVQHMPPMFTRLLAERMSAQFAIPVHEAQSGCVLEPGHAWIAPGDHHMIAVREGLRVRLLLHQDAPENSCRPAVDVLLRSVAQAFGPRSLTVILTGMGQDGLRGCAALRAAGGQILVQDEATSVVWGMPGHVARAGLADRVLPLSLIGDAILRRVRAQRPG